ncbi:hypothetical protein quinque_013926 [Culex quinquefasciatus]
MEDYLVAVKVFFGSAKLFFRRLLA